MDLLERIVMAVYDPLSGHDSPWPDGGRSGRLRRKASRYQAPHPSAGRSNAPMTGSMRVKADLVHRTPCGCRRLLDRDITPDHRCPATHPRWMDPIPVGGPPRSQTLRTMSIGASSSRRLLHPCPSPRKGKKFRSAMLPHRSTKALSRRFRMLYRELEIFAAGRNY